MGEGLTFGILWIVFSILGEVGTRVLIRNNPLYYTASVQGVMVQQAFDFILVFLVPIFVFVVLFLIYTLFRFRSRDGQPAKPNVRYATNNKMFAGIWITISVLVNLLFFIHPTTSAMEQMFAMEQPSANKGDLVVNVTARQWEWIFSYPQYGLTQTVNANGQDMLELPVNRTVKFVLRSYDPFHTYDQYASVIHSFWIPAFGIKEDVIPGETRTEYITPTKITSYSVNPMVRVQCAEVCGPGHPWMEAPLNIVSSANFQQWITYEKSLQSGQA